VTLHVFAHYQYGREGKEGGVRERKRDERGKRREGKVRGERKMKGRRSGMKG
jgi:hypothetical protein